VLRPLTWVGAYAAFGLILMAEFWLFLPVIVLLGGEKRLLLYPFAVLWHAVAGGVDGGDAARSARGYAGPPRQA
jgi:hypothetical protein